MAFFCDVASHVSHLWILTASMNSFLTFAARRRWIIVCFGHVQIAYAVFLLLSVHVQATCATFGVVRLHRLAGLEYLPHRPVSLPRSSALPDWLVHDLRHPNWHQIAVNHPSLLLAVHQQMQQTSHHLELCHWSIHPANRQIAKTKHHSMSVHETTIRKAQSTWGHCR